MAILEATTSVEQLRVARCPYPDCNGIRPYFKHPDTGVPTPIDHQDIKTDASRARYPVQSVEESIVPHTVVLSRSKNLVNKDSPDERYIVEDSFVVPGKSWDVNSFVGYKVRIDFPDPEYPAQRHRVARKVASNTTDTIVLNHAIPADFDTSLDDVKVLVIDEGFSESSKRSKAKKIWEASIFVCPECGKIYYVDKP